MFPDVSDSDTFVVRSSVFAPTTLSTVFPVSDLLKNPSDVTFPPPAPGVLLDRVPILLQMPAVPIYWYRSDVARSMYRSEFIGVGLRLLAGAPLPVYHLLPLSPFDPFAPGSPGGPGGPEIPERPVNPLFPAGPPPAKPSCSKL